MIDFVTVLAGMYGYRIPKAAGDHRDQRTLKESRMSYKTASVDRYSKQQGIGRSTAVLWKNENVEEHDDGWKSFQVGIVEVGYAPLHG